MNGYSIHYLYQIHKCTCYNNSIHGYINYTTMSRWFYPDRTWMFLCGKKLLDKDLGSCGRLFNLAVSHSTKTVPSCVFSVAPCSTMSSVIPSTPGTSLITLLSLSLKTSPETFKPNGILSHLYLPNGVLNVVRRLLLKSKGMCQNLDVASFTVKYLDCASSSRMSSRVLVYH